MPKDWDSVKAHIERLYLRENKSLSEVVVFMRTNYRFDASVRAYRMRLSDWGYHKTTCRENSTIQKKALSPKPSWASTQRTEAVSSYFITFPAIPKIESNSMISSHISNTTVTWGDSDARLNGSRAYDMTPLQTLLEAISNRSLKDLADCLSWNMLLANERCADGKMPLHYAAAQGAGELVELLVTAGADINAVDSNQKTPLHLAVGSPKTVEAIIKCHPKISLPDGDGHTPLHLAINLCNLDEPLEGSSIELLVGAGADVNTLNYKKESPVYLIIQKLPAEGKHQISYIIFFCENNASFNGKTPRGEQLWSFLAKMTKFRWSSLDYITPSNLRNQDLKLIFSQHDLWSGLENSQHIFLQTLLNSGILDDGHDYELGQILCQKLRALSSNSFGETALHSILRMANMQALSRYEENIRILMCHMYARSQLLATDDNGLTPLQILFRSEKSTPEAKVKIMKLLATTGNIHLWESGDWGILPIYEAARLGDNGYPIIKLILDEGSSVILEGIAREYKILQYPFDAYISDICLWRDYYALIEEEKYHELEIFCKSLDQFTPADILERLKPLACAYAAEKLLAKAKEDFRNGAENGHKIVSILQICRKLGLEFDFKLQRR